MDTQLMKTSKFQKKGENKKMRILGNKGSRGITLIALVITIVLNSSYLAMERMLKKQLILKII